MQEQNVAETQIAPSSIYTSGKTERLWRRIIQWVLTVKCKGFSVSNGEREAVGRCSTEVDGPDEILQYSSLKRKQKSTKNRSLRLKEKS